MDKNENKKQNMIFDNIKTLSAIITGNNVSTLRNNVKNLKNELDSYNRSAKVKELNFLKEKELAAVVEVKVVPKIEEKPAPVVQEKIELKPTEPVKEQSPQQQAPVTRSNNYQNNRPQYSQNNGQNRPYNNYQSNTNSGQPTNNNQQTANNGTQTGYNGQRPYTPRPYNNDNTQNNNYQRPYNNNNNNTQNNNFQRPYNNYNTQNNNFQRPYNNNGQTNNVNGAQRPYTPRPYNNNTQPGSPPNNNFQRPYNNNNNGQSNYQRPYNPNFTPRPYNPNFSAQRPANGAPRPPFNSRPQTTTPLPQAPQQRNFTNKSKGGEKHFEEKKNYDKRTLLRRGLIEEQNIEDRMLTRKYRIKKKVQDFVAPAVTSNNAILTTNNITVKILSEAIGKPVSEIIKKFMLLNMPVTINSAIDFESAELVASELGMTLAHKVDKTSEEKLSDIRLNLRSYADADAVVRPPIVTIMGHVDHGKTSLLDYIRKANVVTGEAGGITQSIGAYRVNTGKGFITFIDTPGHEAFTAMRLRGAMVTDIAILIVAADDGIMPQTVEAIKHIKAAKVPMIVAINKIDKESADADKILQQLTIYEVIPEAWGGDTIIVPLSAKTGEGVDRLLEMINLVAEMQQLRANPNIPAIGTIVESNLDRGRGAMASLIVKDGTLRRGDSIVTGLCSCRVKTMIDDKGVEVDEATPSMPVRVVGFSEVPNAGDSFTTVDEKLVREIIADRRAKIKDDMTKVVSATTLEEMMNKMNVVEAKVLNVIIKSDVGGSLEAIRQSLAGLNNEKTRVNVISGSVGNVSESDVVLADASKSIILVFNTKADSKAKTVAERQKIQMKNYKVIYELIEDVEKLLKNMIEPTYRKEVIGQAEVKLVFKLSTNGYVAGSQVKDGKITRNGHARVYRNGEIVSDNGTITSLKIIKEDVKEATKGYECGIKLNNYDNYEVGDIIECYNLVKEEV